MGFEEFTEHVSEAVRVKAGGAYQIKRHDVTKNNNVKRTGIIVMKEEADIGPCVYLDAFYREYETGGMRSDEIVDDVSGFREWETVKGNVRAKLINAEQNKELLEKIPHRMFLDLAVVYYAVVRDQTQEETGTVLIRREHMEIWGQEEEILYQTAVTNMRAEGGADFTTLEDIIKRVMPEITLPAAPRDLPWDTGMYILTNRRKRFGAAEILDKKTLRMIADRVGDGFIVLPSSLHEMIVLPPNAESEYERLADMVREVNDTQVDVEERLSYHVYAYSRDEETLKIVA